MGDYSGSDATAGFGADSGRFPADQRHLRVSDAERDVVAAELGEALAEGRLTPDEHAERLDVLFRARTQGELVPLLADLPQGRPLPRPFPDRGQAPGRGHAPVRGAERYVRATPTSTNAQTIMSGTERAGEWVLPAYFTAYSLMGSVTLDLREARFTARTTTIKADTFCGAVEVIVPDDVVVRVDGSGIMGDFGLDGDQPAVHDPDAPVVEVVGTAVMGSVWAVYKPRRYQRPKRHWRQAVREGRSSSHVGLPSPPPKRLGA